MTVSINLVEGYKFTNKDGVDFTFIWAHDRGLKGRDEAWMNTRRVREELALRMQHGGLSTQHDKEKRRQSFLIWRIFYWNFNLQIGKSFNFI